MLRSRVISKALISNNTADSTLYFGNIWNKGGEHSVTPNMTKKIALVGGHGKIALLMTEQAQAEGVETRNIIRNTDQMNDISTLGGTPVVVDVEKSSVKELAEAFDDADAVVFAAGGGPDSGIFRKYTIDLAGSIKAQQAARAAGVSRFVQISFIGAEQPVAEGTDETFAAYWDAKREADNALRQSGLDYTIVKPGLLTDDAATEKLNIADIHSDAEIPAGDERKTRRGDVAGFILNIIDDKRTYGRDLAIWDGGKPLDESLNEALA